MSKCACKSCVRRASFKREDMTLLASFGDSRETRAGVIGGVLLIAEFDRFGVGHWERDPESGVSLDPDAVAKLRELLAPPADGQDVGKVR